VRITDNSRTNDYFFVRDSDGHVAIGSSTPSDYADLLLEDGVLCIKETTTPTADANYGKIYTKDDNDLYFQDGAGTEKSFYSQSTIDGSLDVTNKVVKADCMFHAYLSADQENLANTTQTVVVLDSEEFDVGADFDTGNNKFVAPVTGYYELHAQIVYKNLVAHKSYFLMVKKDFGGGGETELLRGKSHSGGTSADLIISTSGLVYLTADDEVKLIAYVSAGVATVDIGSSKTETFLMGRLVAT